MKAIKYTLGLIFVLAAGFTLPGTGLAQITIGDPGNFITTWQSDNPGTSDPNQITIPTEGGGYNYNVYWEATSDPAVNGSVSGVTGDQDEQCAKAGLGMK